MSRIQAIIVENKIFVPCTYIEDEQHTLYGYSSIERKGWVTPNLHYLYTDKVIELEEYGKYHSFKIEDTGINKQEYRFTPSKNTI